ncbi:DUF5067 domain-containing protein [Carnobacterium maltaromaticum]|uniref:DUF5067 domain-containing protein n=1 Tax=Carnobacterium maltaromaticum TaxID=2751 RepID=UPI003B986D4C
MKKWRKINIFALMLGLLLLVGCGMRKEAEHDVSKDFTYDKKVEMDQVVEGEEYSVRVTGYKVIRDSENMPALMMYYEFVNSSEEEISPYDLYMDAYQTSKIADGDTELYEADIYDGLLNEEDLTLLNNTFELVEPESQLKCATVWKLRNNKYPLEVEVYSYEEEYLGMIQIDMQKGIVEGSTEI